MYNKKNMDTTNILRIVLTLGWVIVVVCAVYITYYFVNALKTFQKFINHADNVAEVIKDGLKLKALAAIPALLVALTGKAIRKKRGR